MRQPSSLFLLDVFVVNQRNSQVKRINAKWIACIRNLSSHWWQMAINLLWHSQIIILRLVCDNDNFAHAHNLQSATNPSDYCSNEPYHDAISNKSSEQHSNSRWCLHAFNLYHFEMYSCNGIIHIFFSLSRLWPNSMRAVRLIKFYFCAWVRIQSDDA